MNKLLTLATIVFAPIGAHAKDLEATHLFGFTLGRYQAKLRFGYNF